MNENRQETVLERPRGRWRRWVATVIVVLILLPPAWVGWQWIGPRAPVPATDPVQRLNTLHADLENNAAELYFAAFDLLEPPPDGHWQMPEGPLSDAYLTWVESMEPVGELALAAANRADCYFPIRRDEKGLLAFAHTRETRNLTRYLAMRARAAEERGDLHTLLDCIRSIRGLARHMWQQPTMIDHLIGLAAGAVALEWIPRPLTRNELSPEEKVRYIDSIQALPRPDPNLAAALEFERDEIAWFSGIVSTGVQAVAMPASRICGEFDQLWLHPYRELLAQPIEQQLAKGNELRQRLVYREKQPLTTWQALANLPRTVARMMGPPLERTIHLRGRYVTHERGVRVVLTLHRRLGAGEGLPQNLSELEDIDIIDPYTNQPFIYRINEDGGFVLYSAGLDRDDDGGDHHDRFGEPLRDPDLPPRNPDGDFVFWPLSTEGPLEPPASEPKDAAP